MYFGNASELIQHSKSGKIRLLGVSSEKRASQLEALNEMPLYPTEEVIWNENVVPTEYFSGEGCLALPKLNLQFLTLHDYLLRNFNLDENGEIIEIIDEELPQNHTPDIQPQPV